MIFTTLVELLRYQAQHRPDRIAYTFLPDGETESGSLTFKELDRRARAIASELQRQGAAGERALLLHRPGLEFISAFFGCLYAGVVAVTAYPPRNNHHVSRIQAIVRDAQATFVLTTASLLNDLQRHVADNPELLALRWLASDWMDNAPASDWREPALDGESLAFLQYTSGSTGTPKGVMVSHGNLLHNAEIMKRGMEHDEETIFLTWLPLFHDMGLIAKVLESLNLGTRCIFMPPAAFLQSPMRWLKAITRYRATMSGAPNFAYELCISKSTPEQLAELDLSSWTLAMNGAEPVRAETMQRFASTFGPCGFRMETFYPCYGMAEATLLVSGGSKGDLPIVETVDSAALEQHRAEPPADTSAETRDIVGCGHTWMGQTMIIVDPESLTQCPDGKVGEVWVSGASVAKGYWNNPQETEKTFHARLADTGAGPFLRTGDLAFMRDGELFVTGRLKDVIIIHGRNHYPQDIELTVERSHPALRPSWGAAFSVEVDGEERLVVAQELERSYVRKVNVEEVVQAIRKAVLEEHDLEVYAVQLLRTAAVPKTSSGKIQRRACRAMFLANELNTVASWKEEPAEAPRRPAAEPVADSRAAVAARGRYVEEIQAWLVSRLAEKLRVRPQDIDAREPLGQYGLDSLKAVGLSGELQEWLGCRLAPTLVYDYPSIEALSHYLAEKVSGQAAGVGDARAEARPAQGAAAEKEFEPIAVIGLGCRFPGAENAESLWRLLREAGDAITEVPPSRWDADAYYDPTPATPGKMSTRWGGFLSHVDEFDAAFFGISPREARNMDPQQRMLLEVSWEALENAGQSPEKLAGGQNGVFVGIASGDYRHLQFADESNLNAYSGTGNSFSIAANRLSYLLDWRGPSWAVDTACSSSLVAIHQACQSLRRGECQLALAGGVNVILRPELTITFSQARMMASDGRCKTFDASADGYVRSEGCGIVVLKRLSDALRDGDNILGLVKGSAVNQDGRSNGLTAPNGLSQQAVINAALEDAGVTPAQIGYVEAHGTGTSLGDPIEVDALKEVLLKGRAPEQTCRIGSIKTNIGHLEAAAGVAGVIKVLLSMQHGEIPPNLHLKQLNPYISIADTPIEIPTRLQEWPREKERRLAGVSSFGFGGTNAHVIIEEAPSPSPAPAEVDRPAHVLSLSAKTQGALRELAQSYLSYFDGRPEASPANVCYTANVGRSSFDHRLAVVTDSTEQLREQLAAYVSGKAVPGVFANQLQGKGRAKVGFLFTGQGAQYEGMGRELYETHPAFREALDRCDEILRPYLERPLLSALYPQTQGAPTLLNETAYTQPATFALEYALATLWMSWGVEPAFVLGHSVGEYVAACVAGVFSLEDALRLLGTRARLMQELPRDGEMAAVFASEERVSRAVEPYAREVSIAAVNGAENVVISGRRGAVQAILDALHAEGVKTRGLNVSHAFHSPLMEPMLSAFREAAGGVTYSAPRIPLVSNVTGEPLAAESLNADYWCRHVLEPVRFATGIETLRREGCEIFLEIGPTPTLLGLGRRCLPVGAGAWLPSLRQGEYDWRQLLSSLAELHTLGVQVDWASFDGVYTRRRVELPTYPFQRERYWVENKGEGTKVDVPSNGHRAGGGRGHRLLGHRLPEFAHLPGNHVWQTEFDRQHLSYVNDHRIHGAVVVPGVVYVEMALAAAKEIFGARPYSLSEIEYNKVLFVREQSAQPLQVSLSGSPEQEIVFRIYSRLDEQESEPWTLHANGKIVLSLN